VVPTVPPGTMEVTAHRGFGKVFPENTVTAARRAAEHADRVEVDVRRCGSGELVASHFERVRFTTDGKGRIGELSADELASLSVQGSGEGIPLVADVADAVPADTGVMFDLKGPALADDTIAVAESIDNRVVVSSFYSDALWEARAAADDLALSYHFDVRLERNATTARLLDCEYVSPHWTVALCTDVVERAQEAGRKVEPWPVTSTAVARLLDRKGVDGIVATTPRIGRREVDGLGYAEALTEALPAVERLRALTP
ncbi:glycerophosphodiester phosphodiesterase, partial [Halobium palmae]